MAVTKDSLTEKELSLLAFWDSRRGNRAMPKRSDFLPEDLFPWMSFLHLLEPIDNGRDFRYAVFTTRTLLGKDVDLNGKFVSDWDDVRVGYAMRLYGTVMETSRPVYSIQPERHEEDWFVYSRLCLPLGSAGGITHIVAMLTPRDEKLDEQILPTAIEI